MAETRSSGALQGAQGPCLRRQDQALWSSPNAEPWLYAWAWDDESEGRLRSRSFPTWAGIAEDEGSSAAAVLMGDRLGRALTIRQGIGSEIRVQPGPEGTVEVGGTCGALVEVRNYPA